MGTRNLLTIGGYIVGAYFGAPQLGLIIGSLVGNAVDPVQVFGPKLSDSKIQTARDGIPINWGAGRFRCAGTVIAVQPGPPTEHEETEGGKGGGPEQVTYRYTRTHAILVCEGPVLGIRRIWRDQKLVYDTAALPTSGQGDYSLDEMLELAVGGLAGSVEFAEGLSIYLGDESQLPDPELEALFGVGEYPAHRGYCYVVFKDDDVTQRGGSISNYEFEVVKAGSIAPYDGDIATPLGWWKLGDSDSGICADSSGGGWDGTWSGGDDVTDVGPIFDGSDASTRFRRNGTGGVAVIDHSNNLNIGTDGTWSAEASFICTGRFADGGGSLLQDLVTNVGSSQFGLVNFFLCLWRDTSTEALYPGGGFSQANQVLCSVNSGRAISLHIPYHAVITKDGTGLKIYIDGELWATQTGGSALITNPPSGNPGWNDGTEGISIGGAAFPAGNQFIGQIENVRIYNVGLTATQVSGLYNATTADALPGAGGWGVGHDGKIYQLANGEPINLISTDTVSLAGFITDICERSGLTAADIDVSDIDDLLEGFVVARETQGASLLNVLAQGFIFDACEEDGLVVFRKRGGASQVTLDADDLVSTDGAPVRETRDLEIERPRKVNVVYFDPDLHYLPTKQTAERLASTVASIGETSVELPIVFEKDTAAQVADKLIKISWTDQLGSASFSLPAEFSYLVPSDIVQLNYRGRVQRLRIEKLDEENGVLMIEARQDRLSAIDSDATGIGDPLTPLFPAPKSPTEFLAMNLPSLREQDNVPGVYFVARGSLPGWPGCVVQISYDGGATYQTAVTIKNQSVMGSLIAPVDDPANSPASEEINVHVRGDMASVTPEQITAGANAFAIVDASNVAEIGQAQTVISEGGGDYLLPDPLRGLLGTDATAHFIGERFAMLASAVFFPIDEATFDGETLYFRAVTIGTLAANAPVFTLVYDPADTEVIIDGGGDPL